MPRATEDKLRAERKKPNPGMSVGGRKCWIEPWEHRMNDKRCMVSVWLSTDPECQHTPWRVYSQHTTPSNAVSKVHKHLKDIAALRGLLPGCYLIECGDLRRTLEVDANA